MKKTVLFLLIHTSLFAQLSKTVTIIDNYNGWEWDSVFVAKNKFIRVAVVPDAAGRVLEYNLGDVPSLWINPKLFGKSFKPTDSVKFDEWRNFGGYRLVPIPINNWAINSKGEKVKRWPPPAIIGDSPYFVNIGVASKGIQTINVCSGIQELPVPLYDNSIKTFISPKSIEERLQYKRSLHIEEGKSVVYIKHTLINKGTHAIERGLKITSQHPTRSKPDLEDGENFLAYIPFNEKYKLPSGKQFEITTTPEARWNFVNKNRFPLDKNNPDHIKKYFNHGTNWNGEVSPGVFEIQYDYNLMSGFHIISSEAWICYVNKINKVAFVDIFEPYDANLNYEYGVNVEVFNSGVDTGYLETEVKTPIYTLKPNESFDYRQIQGAAKIISTPVIEVNKTGIITKKLSFDKHTNIISGDYGVFYEGQGMLQLVDNSGRAIESIALEEVNPLKAFTLKKILKKSLNMGGCKLFIKDVNDKLHLLDSLSIKN